MLKNTGERLILDDSWNLMTTLEHLHRYNAVKDFVKGKVVLDAACGTGYGTHILSQYAEKVYGIDLSNDAIEYAKYKYQNKNLIYQQMSVTELQFPSHYFDTIVSFETIEHITKESQEQFLSQILDKLKPDGQLIISTPNDQLMRDISYGNYVNPYHLCEFNEQEYLEFLKKYFKYVKFFYQTVTEVSSIVPKGIAQHKGSIFSLCDNNSFGRYYVAICSNVKQEFEYTLESCLLPEPKSFFNEQYFTWKSVIYADCGSGFTGNEKIEASYISKNDSYDVTFNFEDFKDLDIKRLRFDPCEHGCKFEILQVVSNIDDVRLVPFNATERQENKDVFLTLDPIYMIECEDPNQLKYLKITGYLSSIQTPVVLDYMNEQKNFLNIKIEHQKEKIEQLNEELLELSNRYKFEKETSSKREDNLKYLENISQNLKNEKLELENTIDNQNNQLLEFEDLVSKLNNKLLEIESQNKVLTKAIQEHSSVIKTLLQNNQELQCKITNQEKEMEILERYKIEATFYEKCYTNLIESSSWKITKPLRVGSDIAKKIFHPALNVSSSKENILEQTELAPIYEQKNVWNFDIPEEEENEPLVSIIVPNYNHAPYLYERLESIYNQTYKNFEVILLDDYSSDNSRDILMEYAKKYPENTTIICNSTNAGKVFKQWNKGISQAKGKYIWIAESDDYSSLNFLQEMVPLLQYQSVMLAFARSVFMQEGKQIWSTEEYLSDILDINWKSSFTMTAFDIVNMAFARKNIIPNVSSVLFRNIGKLPYELTSLWENLKLSGDWLFYLYLIRGGCISYTTQTTNFYRVHAESTSLKIQNTFDYYKEFQTISEYIVNNYKITTDIFKVVEHDLIEHYKAIHHVGDDEAQIVKEYYNTDVIAQASHNRKLHILIAEFSMKLGGGETYPLYLANELKRQGYTVTVLDFRMDTYEPKVRSLLHPSVPLVEIGNLDNLYQILYHLGGDIIHSHHGCVDGAIADWLNDNKLNYKHIITLHGMYEAIEEKDCKDLLNRVCKSCSNFIYIADKNLIPFKKWGYLDKASFTKMSNGLPQSENVKPIERSKLNIPENAFVLCLVSRGIAEKGWSEAIEAVKQANSLSKRSIHLVIVGDGPIRQELENMAPNFVHFMGTQSNVRDYFSMADVGFLPTRFQGESYPLVVIESLLCGKPVIATDVAEIKNQLTDEDGELAGILLHLNNWKLDIEEISNAICNMADSNIVYQEYQSRVSSAAKKFDLSVIASQYLEIYYK